MKIFNKIKGDAGETKVCRYLKKQKYKIIKRNFKNHGGEIDIIVKKDDVTVFVEVKTRTDSSFGFGAEAVDNKKQNKIKRAAILYAQKHKVDNMRFDVAEVYINENQINYIENAF